MAVATIPSSTGPATLPDVGTLAYNGVRFSSLFASKATATPIADDAKRTLKCVEVVIQAEGVVTLPDGATTTDNEMDDLRQKLGQQAGALLYSGKGLGTLAVNVPGGSVWDVEWGPVPQVLDFKPLGGSRSALVSFRIVTRMIPAAFQAQIVGKAQPSDTALVLQWNYGITITYDEEGYLGYAAQGVLEIPLTRTAQEARDVAVTVDAFRGAWLDFPTDLTRFRETRRQFGHSPDRRTCKWEIAAEEIPPMGLPPGCTNARGTMSVRDVKLGKGAGGVMTGVRWGVSLRATYTVRPDESQYIAALAFYALLWFRMQCSTYAIVPPEATKANAAQNPLINRPPQGPPAGNVGLAGINPETNTVRIWNILLKNANPAPANKMAAILTGFSFDEGLYLDSKTITFQASWWVMTTFPALFRATGAWRWLEGSAGGSLWAQSVSDIMGFRSWSKAELDPDFDAVVDLGFTDGPPLTR